MTRRRMLLVALSGTCLVAAVGAVWQSSRIATVTAVYREDGLLRVQARVRESLDLPNVPWEVASPDNVALSNQALESLRASLAAQDTDSLIVARQGRIALEWYGPDHGPNRREPLAAAVKGITASVLLMAALTDGLVGLDDRVAQYVPEWGQVTLRHLASYSSSRVSGTATTCSTTASSSME